RRKLSSNPTWNASSGNGRSITLPHTSGSPAATTVRTTRRNPRRSRTKNRLHLWPKPGPSRRKALSRPQRHGRPATPNGIHAHTDRETAGEKKDLLCV